MIHPNALQQGDTVMIIAPSGPPTIENVLKGVTVLQEMGLSVVIGKSVSEKYGYLAGRIKSGLMIYMKHFQIMR